MRHDLKESIIQFPSPPSSCSVELINSACLMHKTATQKRKILFSNNSSLLKGIWLFKSPFDPITVSNHVPRGQTCVDKAFWKHKNCNYVLQESSSKSQASPWRFQRGSSAHACNPNPMHYSDTKSLPQLKNWGRRAGKLHVLKKLNKGQHNYE